MPVVSVTLQVPVWHCVHRGLVVFDGASSAAKLGEDAERRAQRQAALTECAALRQRKEDGEQIDGAELRQLAKRAFRRSETFTNALQEALADAGFQCRARGGGLAAGMWLAITGRVQYVLSEDADLVALCCPRVLRGGSPRGARVRR